MKQHRVLVTGVGVVSPLGLDVETHFQRLLGGESGVVVESAEAEDLYPVRSQVEEFNPRSRIRHRMLRKILPRSATFAVIAAGQALRDGRLDDHAECLAEGGLYVGSVLLDIDYGVFVPALRQSLDSSARFSLHRFASRGMKVLDPLFLIKALPNAGLCGTAIDYQLFGPNLNVTNGPVSGLQAVATAAAAIRRGETRLAVAGGYDTLLHIENTIEHLMAGRLTRHFDCPQRACRPFDRERDGYVPGEGAAFLVLESEEHARARGAGVYGEILATAHTTEAAPAASDADRCSALVHAGLAALQRAGCPASELEVLFGDGLATEDDDLREAAAAGRILQTSQAVFTAATGSLGFTGAASGAFSAVHALLGMRRGVTPPMINCRQPDPRCALPFVHQPCHRAYRRALVWTSDRGVKNVAVLVGRYPA